jgi:hypothetical protein
MREVAERESSHDQVRYLPGSAENIPAADQSVDYCLLHLVWHHVRDRAGAAKEIARVLRPGAPLLCRSQFSDHMFDLWWLRHFPSGPEADAAMYRSLAEEVAVFGAAGLTPSPLAYLGRRAVPGHEVGTTRAATHPDAVGAAQDAGRGRRDRFGVVGVRGVRRAGRGGSRGAGLPAGAQEVTAASRTTWRPRECRRQRDPDRSPSSGGRTSSCRPSEPSACPRRRMTPVPFVEPQHRPRRPALERGHRPNTLRSCRLDQLPVMPRGA